MQTTMQLAIYGAETGVIEDKETKKRTPWTALHIAHSFDGPDGIGMKTERVRATDQVFDQLRTIKLPYLGSANVELVSRAVEGRGLMMQMRVVSLVPAK